MKQILPSLKEKNRYLVYSVSEDLSFNEVKKIIQNNILRFLGELEMAKANIRIMDDFKYKKGIIKVDNKYTDKLRSSLILIKSPVIQTIGISGTLKKARLKFLKEGIKEA
ncbi:MAG: Rpp14/Pop5 family protein [archaeon]